MYDKGDRRGIEGAYKPPVRGTGNSNSIVIVKSI